MSNRKPQRWFISHPSKSQQHTPTFFYALERFGGEHTEITLILPHERNQTPHLTRQDIEKADLFIAEVSLPSTGSGIEMGWANVAKKRIIVFQQAGTQSSPAIGFVTNEIHLYVSEQDITKILEGLLEK